MFTDQGERNGSEGGSKGARQGFWNRLEAAEWTRCNCCRWAPPFPHLRDQGDRLGQVLWLSVPRCRNTDPYPLQRMH